MSLQIAILKVLSSHPDGRANISAIKSDLAVLTASGRDWSERVRRLAARVPNLDIFGQRYVIRDASGWTISDAGRDFLRSLERPLIDDYSDTRLFQDEERAFNPDEFMPRRAEDPAPRRPDDAPPRRPQPPMPEMAPARAYQARYPIRY